MYVWYGLAQNMISDAMSEWCKRLRSVFVAKENIEAF